MGRLRQIVDGSKRVTEAKIPVTDEIFEQAQQELRAAMEGVEKFGLRGSPRAELGEYIEIVAKEAGAADLLKKLVKLEETLVSESMTYRYKMSGVQAEFSKLLETFQDKVTKHYK